MVSTPIPPEESVQNENVQKEEESQYKLVGRVMAYPTVNTILETAKGYYDAAKEQSTLVKKGCEMAESTAKSIITPIIENEQIKKISEPILTSADGFACKQLDTMEKLTETYQPKVTAIKDDLVAKGQAIITTSAQKLEDTDQYLKNNYFAAPLNIAVDTIEKYVPEKAEEKTEADKKTEEPAKTSPGPIKRGGQIAYRLQQEAINKLSNLSLRNTETLNSYQHVVDLIQYAAQNLDSGVQATTKYVNNGGEKLKETAKNLKESAEPTIKHTTEQVQELTTGAVQALTAAIEILSSQIPQPITATSQAIINRSKDLAVGIQAENMEFYSTLAAVSAQKLRETSARISSSIQSASDMLPHDLVDSAKATLTSILESLTKTRDYTVGPAVANPTASSAVPAQ